MYMSHIDHKFNMETKMTPKQIRHTFRKGLNKELVTALKKNHDAVDLMKDTTKSFKELNAIYAGTTLKFDKTPDQQNYSPPVSEKNNYKDQVKNGQLVVESNSDERFMNTKVQNPNLVPALFNKYKCDVYIFINQLDILSEAVLNNEIGKMSERKIRVHYTVFTIDAKEINSGLAEIKFPGDLNSPEKISSSYLSKIASEIALRIDKALVKYDQTSK